MPATHNPTLRLRSTSAAVHVSAYFAISFRKMTSTSSSFINYMYVRRTCIIKGYLLGANLQTASTKSQATMGPQAKRFLGGVFLAGGQWPDFTCLLGASRSVFESTCIYSPTRLWRGATGNRKAIGVSPT